jgi:hypothetical protein
MMESLHAQAIDWIAKRINGLNNHCQQHIKVDTFVPDVVVNDELHEVETVNTKKKLKTIRNKKTLWVVVPMYEVYDTIRVIGQTEQGGFATIAETQQPKICLQITDPEEIKKGLNQCETLAERVYFLRVICGFKNYEIAERLGIDSRVVVNAASWLRSKHIDIPDGRTTEKTQLERRMVKIVSHSISR